MTLRGTCKGCGRVYALTSFGLVWRHGGGCPGSGERPTDGPEQLAKEADRLVRVAQTEGYKTAFIRLWDAVHTVAGW